MSVADVSSDVETIREALRAAYERFDVVDRGMWNLTGAIAALDRLAVRAAGRDTVIEAITAVEQALADAHRTVCDALAALDEAGELDSEHKV